jgi:NADPH2:quinone reductase
MNAAVVASFETPPRYTTFPEPTPGDHEVLVTVTAAGLHPIVKALASGTHYMAAGVLPFIPGLDGTGRLEDGSRVYFGGARPPFGTFAERSVAVRSRCLPIPDGLDDVMVAAMVNPGMSSWAALSGRAQFAAGESILILGATGAAGQLAVQVAKRIGARRVVAAGRNPEALARLTELGADAVISLSQGREELISALRREWDQGGIDVVLDYVWGAPAEAVLQTISQKGFPYAASRLRYVQVGAMAGANISLPAATLRSTALELMGSGFGGVSLAKIFEALGAFLREAGRKPFQMKVETASLRDVEALWLSPQGSSRLVFRP